jgi:hypothetical protein
MKTETHKNLFWKTITLEPNDYIDYIKLYNYELDYAKFELLFFNILQLIKFNKNNYNIKKSIIKQIILNGNKYIKKITYQNLKISYGSALFFNNKLICKRTCQVRSILYNWIPALITYLILLFKKHNIKKFDTNINEITIVKNNFSVQNSKLLNYLVLKCSFKTIISIIISILEKSLNKTITENDLLLDHDFEYYTDENDKNDYCPIDTEIVI